MEIYRQTPVDKHDKKHSLTGAPTEIFRVVPEPHMANSISTVYSQNAKWTNTHIHHVFLKRLLHGSFNSIVPFKCYCKQLWCWAPFKGLHQRWEALTFSGRTAGQMPAYFKRQTAPTLRPCCCSSSRTTTVSERQKVSSHTKSSSPSWQYVKCSDKEDIQKKKKTLWRPPFKKSLDQSSSLREKHSDTLSWSVSNQIHGTKDTARTENNPNMGPVGQHIKHKVAVVMHFITELLLYLFTTQTISYHKGWQLHFIQCTWCVLTLTSKDKSD